VVVVDGRRSRRRGTKIHILHIIITIGISYTMSSAGSTSTQWPSAPSSIASSQGDDLSNLQGILDRALIDPSSNQAEDTQVISDNNIKINCKQAAHKIKDADILLVVTGAGFSADSGLATYIDVADVEAYNRKGWTYRDLCQPPSFIDNHVDAEEVENDTKGESDILEINNLHDEALSIDPDLLQQFEVDKDKGDIREPKYFYGFWGQCVNDYRRVQPHEGYDIIARWRESKNTTTIAQEICKITQHLEQYGSDDEVCDDEKEEPYYVSPTTKRAGGFFLFTSNVDAHSYDTFESHKIRECHGNVELWQCHNFACGTNSTNMSCGGSLDRFENDDDSEVEMNKEPVQQQEQQWQRRLWRLPLDHHFVVDSNNMAAPETRVNEEATSSIPDSPVSKRRKSTTNNDCHDNITDDTATALAGIMEDTLKNHLENGGTDNADTDINKNSHAHVGDVHGKPRLFPLKHMNHPDSSTQLQDHFLPIASGENWPKCPRCNEGARPAVLMFNDLDWVYNRSQEERWQNWCESLLKLCKRRSRGLGANDEDDDSMSTTSEANMSDSGWNNMPEPDIDSKPLSSSEDKVDEKSKASSHNQQNSITSPQSSNDPLRIAILEVGCGYNVPTCRVVAESLISELLMRGGDATLIRINPTHSEPDDDDIEDNIISIPEKGLAALKLIDEHYKELIEAGEDILRGEDERGGGDSVS